MVNYNIYRLCKSCHKYFKINNKKCFYCKNCLLKLDQKKSNFLKIQNN